MSLFTPFANMQGPSGGQIVTDSLEQYIDPAVSPTADQSGNGRNVSLQGGLSVSSGAYVLNATGKYIEAGWSQTLNAQWTWAAWMNVTTVRTTAPPNVISNYKTSTTPYAQLQMEDSNDPNPGSLVVSLRTTTGNQRPDSDLDTTDLADSTWHYLAYAYDATTGQLKGWVDGVNTYDVTDGTETGNYTSGQNIIVYGGHLARYFVDALGGPFQLYSKMLTDDEILQNFDADKARFGL